MEMEMEMEMEMMKMERDLERKMKLTKSKSTSRLRRKELEYVCVICKVHLRNITDISEHVSGHLDFLRTGRAEEADEFHNLEIGNKQESIEYQCSLCKQHFATPGYLAKHVHDHLLSLGLELKQVELKQDEDDNSKIGYGHKDEEDEYNEKDEGREVCITDDSLAHASRSKAGIAEEDFNSQEKKVKELDINTTFSLVGVDYLHKFVEGKSFEVPVLPHFAQEFFRNAEMSRDLPSSENLGLQVRDAGEVGNVNGERNDLTEMVRKLEEKVKELDIKTTLSLMGVDYLHKFVNGKSPEEPDVSHLAQELYMIRRRRCYGN